MWTLSQLIEWAEYAKIEIGSEWVPVRPTRNPLLVRIRDAWSVLKGKADAFKWPKGQ